MNEFMSPDGAVPAPGGPANDTEEDTEGGFAHGGWSMPYFDPDVIGSIIAEGMNSVVASRF